MDPWMHTSRWSILLTQLTSASMSSKNRHIRAGHGVWNALQQRGEHHLHQLQAEILQLLTAST